MSRIIGILEIVPGVHACLPKGLIMPRPKRLIMPRALAINWIQSHSNHNPSPTQPQTWVPYAAQPTITSIVQLSMLSADGEGCWGGSAGTQWLGAVPVVTPRLTLWGHVENGTQPSTAANPDPSVNCATTPAAAAAVLNRLPRDGHDPDSGFSVVPVRMSLSNGIGVDAAATMASLLHPGVEAVNPFVFFKRLQKARHMTETNQTHLRSH